MALLASVLIALAVYLVSHAVPATYEASGVFRVTVPNQQGVNDSVVTAANDLATQYAQLADSTPVLDGAAASLHVPVSSLDGQISGSTISAQNLVQVTARSRSAAQAQARSRAAVIAMVTYLDRIDSQQGTAYASNASRYLSPINSTLAQVTRKLRSDRPAQRATDSVVLATLLEQRQQALASLATDAAAGEPNLQLISTNGNASQVSPRPMLYALIAFVIALILAARAAYVHGRRRAG